jgi:hypothetical protein
MRRSLLAGAALAVLLSLTACQTCDQPTAQSTGRGVVSRPPTQRVVIERRREITTMCQRYCNIDACYLSEADTAVHRLRDCLPWGGCCCDCERIHRECQYKEHCDNCGVCE